MSTKVGKSVVVINRRSGSHLKVGDNLLGSAEGIEGVLNEVFEAHPSEFGRKDLAVLSLLCAPKLPGSEQLDIPKCLARLDQLTAVVKATIHRNLYRFPNDPEYSHCEPMWRMANLVTLVKRDFGVAYNPNVRDRLLANVHAPLADSRDMFIHGLLDDDQKRRWGTCASIPVLVAAVARRLGYPVGLAVAGRHIYAKWEGGGYCFNIEASNPKGMVVHSDEDYGSKITEIVSGERSSGYYLRTLYPAEEFALFLTVRVECLIDLKRYEETLLWSARALQFAPDDPRFPYIAHHGLDLALRHRLRQKHPDRHVPPPDQSTFYIDTNGLLRQEERSLFLTIVAHFKESKGEMHEARQAYEDACRQNFHGNNEHRDLQRFLHKYGLPSNTGPLLPPKNLGFPRRVTISCPPHEEAKALRLLAGHWERSREFVKARNAWHDLYMFNPADTDVFDRARAFDELPEFQSQLRELIAKRRRAIQQKVDSQN